MNYSRRDLLAMASSIGVASLMDRVPTVRAQPGAAARSRTIETSALTIGFEESGDPQGFPIVLLHGFPDDARAYDRVAPTLVTAGYRVIVPYLRGYGPTRIRDPRVRTGEQAAIGQDVIDLMDAIGVKRFAVSGYDWGGRAGCIAAALHRDRVRAAVFISGYLIQDTISDPQPAPPERERAIWYQVLLQHRTRPARARGQSSQPLSPALGDMVADLEVHRRGIQQDSGVVRQSGFRRRRDSLVPASYSERTR